MSMYSVGAVVLVREDLTQGYRYKMRDGREQDVVSAGMAALAGTAVTITEANPGEKYRISESRCWWTDGMFSGLASEVPPLTIDTEALDDFLTTLYKAPQ